MEDYSDIKKKIDEVSAKARAAGKSVDISGILNRHVRQIATPKEDTRGANKMVPGSIFVSNNYDAVAFASKNGLIDRGLAAAYMNKYGRDKQITTPGQYKEAPKGRTLEDAVFDAEKKGKLVDVSGLMVATHGSGDKAYEKVQGYRTVDADKFSGTYSGTKKGLSDLPIISNNHNAYALAAEELGRGYLGDQFRQAYPQLSAGKPAKKSPGVKAAAKAGIKSPGRNASPQDRLAFMYNRAVQEGGLLDVSNINQDGTGTKVVKNKSKVPKGGITRVHGGDEAYLISNNYDSYRMATDLLGPDFDQYADAYMAEHGTGKLERPPAKAKTSPKTKRITGKIAYQRSNSKSPARRSPSPANKSPARSAGRSNSPLVRRLSQELADERNIEKSLERSLERARSASRSASKSPVRSTGRSASPRAASPVRTTAASTTGRVPVPRRGLNQAGRTGQI